jgi:DNA-binding NarL/FixJ family response regulator
MRPKGIPNKNKRSLKARLKQEYGEQFDVIMMMAENCNTVHEAARAAKAELVSNPLSIELLEEACNAARTANAELARLAEYVEPKLKSTEVSFTEEPIMLDHVIEFVGVSDDT